MELAVKKEIGIDIFIIVFTILFFWLLSFIIAPTGNLLVMTILLLIIPVWIACMAITLTVVNNLSAAILTLVIPAMLLLLNIRRLQIETIVVAVIIMILLASARMQFMRELKSRIKFKPRVAFYPGMKLLVIAIIMLLVGISTSYITDSLQADKKLFSEDAVRLLLKPYEPYIVNKVPGASLDGSIDEVVEAQLRQQYPNDSEEIDKQKEIINQQVTNQLSDQLNQEVSPTDDLASIVTTALNDRTTSLAQKYPIITPLIVLSVMFFVSRFIAPLLTTVLLALVIFFVVLARKAKLINLTVTSEPVEHLEL